MSDERKLETWQNVCRGRIGVKKRDKWGDGWKAETVAPGRKVQLTTEERQWNSEQAANAKLDVFRNGYLVPVGDTVKILDGTEDARDIASNPNLLSEGELRKLFKGTQKAFAEKLSGITNTATLRHLLDLSDSEDVDASVKHVKIIENRLIELEPDLDINEVEQVGGDIQQFRPVSPN